MSCRYKGMWFQYNLHCRIYSPSKGTAHCRIWGPSNGTAHCKIWGPSNGTAIIWSSGDALWSPASSASDSEQRLIAASAAHLLLLELVIVFLELTVSTFDRCQLSIERPMVWRWWGKVHSDWCNRYERLGIVTRHSVFNFIRFVEYVLFLVLPHDIEETANIVVENAPELSEVPLICELSLSFWCRNWRFALYKLFWFHSLSTWRVWWSFAFCLVDRFMYSEWICSMLICMW